MAKRTMDAIHAGGGIAVAYEEITEAEFAAGVGAAYAPPERGRQRVVAARIMQLLQDAPGNIQTTQAVGATIRMPSGVGATNDAGDGREVTIFNNGVGDITVQNSVGGALVTISVGHEIKIVHEEANAWRFFVTNLWTRTGGQLHPTVLADRVGVGTSASHGVMTLGMVIDQLGADDLILSLKSSDVDTQLTTATLGNDVEVDDYFTVEKAAADSGGVRIKSLAEGIATATIHETYVATGSADVIKSTAGRAYHEIYIAEHDGANTLQNPMTADANIFAVRAHIGGADVARLLLDEDGDLMIDGAMTVGGIAAADASAILQSDSTTRGWLPPRMTTAQRDAIVLPATGLIVYNTTTNQWEGNSGTPAAPSWVILG